MSRADLPAGLRHFVLEAVMAALRLNAMLHGTAPAAEAVTTAAPPRRDVGAASTSEVAQGSGGESGRRVA